MALSKLRILRSIRIEAPSDLKALDQVLCQFNQIYQNSIPLRDWLQCRLALAEGFTNAVRHAHKNLPSDIPVKIEVLLKETGMEIKIWDYGSAFDLQAFIAETAKKHKDWLGSGRGIPILNKISSRLDYFRTEKQQNCLLIVKEFAME
ncbi:MAG: ATP-binding protein [Cyanobacteria bacterium J06621_8]